MLDATSSFVLFAAIWALVCVLAGVLVTDTLLKDSAPSSLRNGGRR